MEDAMRVNEKEYRILKLLGHGKGGYSYLAEREGMLCVLMLLSPDLRAAEKDLKELVADYHFLQEHGIHTTTGLKRILSNPSLSFPLWSVSAAASATASAAPSRRRNRHKTRNAARRYPSR